METKLFPLRTVLTVTTGRLLTNPDKDGNGIGALYEILEWMTGEAPYTHQLGRFGEECRPVLLDIFPELRMAGVYGEKIPDLDQYLEEHGKDGVEKWVAMMQKEFPEIQSEYLIPKINPTSHVSVNPILELANMMGTKGENVSKL
jgi:hypothetical protein